VSFGLVGNWLLVISHWLLVIGYWLLVIGYWLFIAFVCEDTNEGVSNWGRRVEFSI